MKRYIIKNTDDINEAPFDCVDQWPWDYERGPETYFRAAHTDDRLTVSLRCFEKDPVAHIDYRNGFVCNDSCMEFFFSPSADNSAGYFNFEMNSNPTIYLGYALSREDKGVLVDWPEEDFRLCTTYDKDSEGRDFWQVDFTVPYEMIRKYVPNCELSSGTLIRGNVYKCGKHDQVEHYGSWNLIETPGPNFHYPEYFGEFVIE
ncbi:MAG: hypothetical protein IJ457_02355 [Clostridia bacterium]|nr:hypothetical protein [Clostridia bacterium]